MVPTHQIHTMREETPQVHVRVVTIHSLRVITAVTVAAATAAQLEESET